MADSQPPFDPIALLAALDRHRVTYIIIGAFARVIQGAEETTRGIDIVPSTRAENLRRLGTALAELHAAPADVAEAAVADRGSSQAIHVLMTDFGEVKAVSQPSGTGGYDDLRRAATREPLGHGLRPSVASVGDLSRMLSALGRGEDTPKILAMRRLAELEVQRGLEL